MESNNFKDKIKANLIPIIVVGLGVVLIAGGLLYSLSTKKTRIETNSWNEDGTLKSGVNCKTEVETVKTTVEGTDIFPPGTEVKVEMNYYACNKGARDEIVMIQSPGKDDPLFKYIKMVPGDKYSVVENKDKTFKVVVNEDSMENASGDAYAFSERKSRMIKLYESNFKEGIKPGVYFVFGENPGGGFDSTRFGPVTSERMVGRVITKPSTEKQ